MSHRTTASATTPFRGLFRSLVLGPGLLLAHVLSTGTIAQIVLREVGETGDPIFIPW